MKKSKFYFIELTVIVYLAYILLVAKCIESNNIYIIIYTGLYTIIQSYYTIMLYNVIYLNKSLPLKITK